MMTKSRKTKDIETDPLDEAQRELDAKIAALKALPQQLELEMIEQERTMPPPEDLEDRKRVRDFEEKAARGQIRNERRTQGRSLLLMFLLLAATAAMVAWVITLAQK
ncbi:hypothetical protein ACFQY0_06345 [Haloferula chungangensis]|uniref:Uncharacterized protein n=1 Tax=Haloferula chungangensis TaxID=1048331 RepID=A0ABW2L4W0_9BACT